MAGFSLRPQAVADLEEIWNHSTENWGELQAERYLRLINKHFRKIADNPDLGPSCDGIREGYRRRRVARHTIFYRMSDDRVEVVRILHERMDVDRHL